MSKIAEEMGLKVGEEFVNESEQWAQLAVQGPNALKAMQKLTSANVVDMKYYTFQIITFAGIENIIFSTTGYTGAGGCEIYMPAKYAKNVWDAVFEAGKEFGIKPAGLGCRDTLRLEMGFCLYGNDIDDTTSPIEAGLGWITKFNDVKGDFIDRDYMLAQKKDGLKRKLVGFELVDRGVPRHGYPVCDAEGNEIGQVTSGTMSPSMKKPVGMAYVATPYNKVDSEIFINVRGRLLKAKVVKTPFYKK